MVKPRSTIENILPYETDKYRHQWRLKLDNNENIYGTNAKILSAIKNINPQDVFLYPCYGRLIDKLASKYELDYDNFLLTNGCDEALNILIHSYLEEDEELLSYNPCFEMPIIYAKSIGAKVNLIDYDEKYIFDIEKIKNNITPKTKIIYIATPDNPTGRLVKANAFDILAKEFNNILFIIDCTYISYSHTAVLEDYIDLIKKYDNIAVVKSFSKDYAMAGLRLGFITADKEIINNSKKISSPYNVNAIAVNCAMMALNDEESFEEIKELNEKAKESLLSSLSKKGFTPYPTEANFILCDFGKYCDFYYKKLKNNGVIVRNFPKNSAVSTCLRITIPKIGGAKFILELLNKKDVLIFDLDGVIFDVSESYVNTIIATFKYFTNETVTVKEIQEAKNLGGMNCDWDVTKYLLKKHGHDIELTEIIKIFQDIFYNPKIKKDNYLIDKEKLLVSKEIFEELSRKYDLVIFSGRLKEEAFYSLKKFDIYDYFYYIITSDDLPKNMLKPHPKGVLEILEHCPYLSIKYLGDNVDDIIAGNKAGIDTIGVVSPNADSACMTNNFKHLGAKYILSDIKYLKTFLEDIDSNTKDTKSIM